MNRLRYARFIRRFIIIGSRNSECDLMRIMFSTTKVQGELLQQSKSDDLPGLQATRRIVCRDGSGALKHVLAIASLCVCTCTGRNVPTCLWHRKGRGGRPPKKSNEDSIWIKFGSCRKQMYLL